MERATWVPLVQLHVRPASAPIRAAASGVARKRVHFSKRRPPAAEPKAQCGAMYEHSGRPRAAACRFTEINGALSQAEGRRASAASKAGEAASERDAAHSTMSSPPWSSCERAALAQNARIVFSAASWLARQAGNPAAPSGAARVRSRQRASPSPPMDAPKMVEGTAMRTPSNSPDAMRASMRPRTSASPKSEPSASRPDETTVQPWASAAAASTAVAPQKRCSMRRVRGAAAWWAARRRTFRAAASVSTASTAVPSAECPTQGATVNGLFGRERRPWRRSHSIAAAIDSVSNSRRGLPKSWIERQRSGSSLRGTQPLELVRHGKLGKSKTPSSSRSMA